jgi:hypothetical protein
MNGPSLALDESGNLHAVWSTGARIATKPLVGDPESSSFRVMYRRFDARERAWSAPLCLAAGTHPRVVVTPDGVPCVTWEGEGIMLARLPSTGPGKPAVLQLSKPEQYGAFPTLARTTDGALVAAWQQSEGQEPTQVYSTRVAASSW